MGPTSSASLAAAADRAAAVLADAALHALLRPVAEAALIALDQMERAGFDGAAQALGAAVTEALLEEVAALTGGAPPPDETTQVAEALGTGYAAACRPRDLRPALPAVTTLASRAIGDPMLFRAFQRLVERDAPIADEVLRAYIVGECVAAGAMFSDTVGIGMPRWMIGAIGQARDGGRIVPGTSVDHSFEVGRETLLAFRDAAAFLGVIAHEVGHHITDGLMGSRSAQYPLAPADGLAVEVVAALPALLDAADAPDAGPQDHLRRFDDGLSVMLTRMERPHGAYVHISLADAGGPIAPDVAAPIALAVVRALGVDPGVAAACHAPRGVFHLAVPGAPFRVARGPADGSGAQAWLDGLDSDSRLVRNAELLAAAVGAAEPRPEVFALDPERSWEDLGICTQLQNGASLVGVPGGVRARVLTSAASFALADLFRTALPDSLEDYDFAMLVPHVGSSLCVVATDDVTVLVPGPTDLVDTLAVLASVGAALDGTGIAAYAATAAPADDLKRLLELSMDIDGRDALGGPPLVRAVAAGRAANVGVLLDAGADVDAASTDGTTSLMLADEAGIRLLGARGADPHARTLAGRTALMLAAAAGDAARVGALLDLGADADGADDDGVTPLHLAASSGADDVETLIDVLVAAGAAVDETTNDGRTPLMWAAARTSSAAVAALLRHGADRDIRDLTGRTAAAWPGNDLLDVGGEP